MIRFTAGWACSALDSLAVLAVQSGGRGPAWLELRVQDRKPVQDCRKARRLGSYSRRVTGARTEAMKTKEPMDTKTRHRV